MWDTSSTLLTLSLDFKLHVRLNHEYCLHLFMVICIYVAFIVAVLEMEVQL